MQKIFKCRDIGNNCKYQVSGNSEEEVLQRVSEHAKTAHNMKEISKELADLASHNDAVRVKARHSLVAMGKATVPLLTGALKSESSLVRWEAAKALGEIGDPVAAPALVQALEDEKFEVRWRAAEGLTKMDVNGLKPLLQALVKDGDSVLLREGAHHVLRNVARGELRNCLLPVLIVLETIWPSIDVATVAFHAIERVEEFQKTHGGTDTGSFKKFTATMSNQSAGLGARKRARRYAKSLQYRAI